MKFYGNVIFFGCESLGTIRSFYGDFLQLELDRDQGKCLIYNLPGGDRLGFCEHHPTNTEGKSPIITFLCKNKTEVDEVYELFKEKGLKLSGPPVEKSEFAIYNFFSEDPEGHTLEVQTFLDGRK